LIVAIVSVCLRPVKPGDKVVSGPATKECILAKGEIIMVVFVDKSIIEEIVAFLAENQFACLCVIGV
jgi:hypothetical protein